MCSVSNEEHTMKGTPSNGSGTPKGNSGSSIPRNSNGTLQKGHPGLPGAGRKKSHRGELVHKLLDEAIDEKTTLRIINVWLANAAAGQPWAVKEFLDRCLGKSDQKLDVNMAFTLAEAVRTITENRFARSN